MAYSIPLAVVANILMLYLSLQVTHMGLFRGNSKSGQEIKNAAQNNNMLKDIIKDRYKALGKWTCHEIQVALMFTVMILILIFDKPGFMMGWAEALNLK